MRSIQVSAPGKVHLIGEHSVVYGEPAIISAINLRTNLILKESSKIKFTLKNQENIFELQELLDLAEQASELWSQGQITNDFSKLFSHSKAQPINFIKIALGTLFKKFNITDGLEIQESSTLPQGSGLGSSASFAVALSAGFQKFFHLSFDLEKINQQALCIEQLINGNPSGGDNTTCCYGGLIKFQQNSESKQYQMQPVDLDLSETSKNFVLIFTGKPEKNTGELVQQVSRLDPTFRNERCQQITSYIEPLLLALTSNDFKKVAYYLNETHLRLAELGVSTPLLDKIQIAIQQIGGGAKLCGAGGGGTILAYHQDAKELGKLADKFNLLYYQTELAANGVVSH